MVLSRFHSCTKGLFVVLSRAVFAWTKTPFSDHGKEVNGMLCRELLKYNKMGGDMVVEAEDEKREQAPSAVAVVKVKKREKCAIFLGNVVEMMNCCVFEDRKKNHNLLLLGRFVGSGSQGGECLEKILKFILEFGFADMNEFAKEDREAVRSGLDAVGGVNLDVNNPPVILSCNSSGVRCSAACLAR